MGFTSTTAADENGCVIWYFLERPDKYMSNQGCPWSLPFGQQSQEGVGLIYIVNNTVEGI